MTLNFRSYTLWGTFKKQNDKKILTIFINNTIWQNISVDVLSHYHLIISGPWYSEFKLVFLFYSFLYIYHEMTKLFMTGFKLYDVSSPNPSPVSTFIHTSILFCLPHICFYKRYFKIYLCRYWEAGAIV